MENIDMGHLLRQMDKASQGVMNDPGAQKQIKDFWNMLNELSENNPEDYKKFIENHLKEGIEDAKIEKAKKAVYSQFSFCVKTYTKGKKEIVLINFCHSDKILSPLKQDKSIADLNDLDSWVVIPASFSAQKTKKTEGKKPMIYYDAHIHSRVIEHALKDLLVKTHIVSSVLRRLAWKEKIELLYDRGDFTFLDSYRSPNDEVGPEGHFLDIGADPEEYNEFSKRILTETQEQEIKIPGLEENKEVNKVMIEEIVNYTIESKDDFKTPEINVEENTDFVKIEVQMPEENSMRDINLELNVSSVKISSPNYYTLIKFKSSKLSENEVIAKWLKKSHMLKLDIKILKF
ncbi:unnamed protein product [Blepharisma stoltei]|uniref:PIH1 domain-containing protein 1 n=1 Tax=Blepharisma stoltei TaxID=1481888 RepID=A0AAU9JAD5_9CILI|nr:unnamed protein product [Blepharisma stoltei]